MSERIVVTGMGCISAAGVNLEEFNDTLFGMHKVSTTNKTSRFSKISFSEGSETPSDVPFNTDERSFLAAQVKRYKATNYFPQKDLKLLDRFAQFALISADEAIKHSKIDFAQVDPYRCAVVHGTSIGGQETIEQSYSQLFELGRTRTHPFTVPKLLPSAAASQISMKYGIKGPSFSTSSACSSAGHAIAMATLMLRCNLIDVAVVGGAEACITKGNFYAWDGLRVLSPEGCFPFSKKRSGLVIGEGAGTLVLERESFAIGRGAKIIAVLSGMGMTSDAHNVVQPLAKGAEFAMKAALEDADLTEYSIDYINAHGSATAQNDLSESQAIKSVFPSKPLVSSTKSFHGHVLGAGAAIEAIACILAMQNQTVPPSLSGSDQDPACDISLTQEHSGLNILERTNIKHALSNSFAFGGLNISLIFSKNRE